MLDSPKQTTKRIQQLKGDREFTGRSAFGEGVKKVIRQSNVEEFERKLLSPDRSGKVKVRQVGFLVGFFAGVVLRER